MNLNKMLLKINQIGTKKSQNNQDDDDSDSDEEEEQD